jgi:prepilin-type N-terminal cleavage/methylation domain-containing protein
MNASAPTAARSAPAGAAPHGFSILELLVALVILGVITAQMFVVLSTQKDVHISQTRTLDLQESARLIVDLIAFDTRNAAMMIPRELGVASLDGGATGPDRFCVSDTTYLDPEHPAWRTMEDRFAGMPTVSAIGVVSGENVFTLSDFDVDNLTPANDWGRTDDVTTTTDAALEDKGIIVAQTDGRASYCGRVVKIASGVATGLVLAPGQTLPTTTGASPPPDLNLAGGLVAVPAVVYSVEHLDNDPDEPLVLMRNGIVISREIEDLQVEFWVDALGAPGPAQYPDGEIDGTEFPVHVLKALPAPPTQSGSPTITPLASIRSVRISVVARASTADVASGGIKRFRLPALANRDEGANSDEFPRKVYSVTVAPRNMF